MLRLKISQQYSNRVLILLLIIVLILGAGYMSEVVHRHLDLAAALGLRESDNTPPLAGQNPTALLRGAVSLLPAAVFNSLPALLALLAIPWLASRFIHTLYDTQNLREAHDFLHRCVFGMSELKPLLIVREGQLAVGAGSLTDRVGGPCLILVYNDSALVTEKGGRLFRVLGGPKLDFLEPFERVWGIVDLRPQRWPFTVNAMTKEGIPISCKANITFKIDDRFIDQSGQVRVKQPVEAGDELKELQVPTELDLNLDQKIIEELEKTGIGVPFPYTEEAVFNAATSIWMRIKQPDHTEQLRRWTGRVVIGGVEGTLRNILAEYRLDWLLQSPQGKDEDPRDEIRKKLEEKLAQSFGVGNSVGAKITNIDIGEIAVRDVKDEQGQKMGLPQKVDTQWIEAWRAGWEQKTVESRIEGEAKLARLNAAQIQAQAEMALTLTEAIRPLVTDAAEDVPSYLLAARFVETLRWMAYDPWKRVFLPPEIIRTLDELEMELNNVKPRPDEPLAGIGRLLVGKQSP